MSVQIPEQLQQQLTAHDQTQVLRYWDDLSDEQRGELVSQLVEVNLEEIAGLVASKKSESDDGADSPVAQANRALPLEDVVRQPATEDDRAKWNAAKQVGLQHLKDGKVGAILVAGGQGTRLGFPHPKGMFPVGPVSKATLFQMFFEQLTARSKQAGQPIPYYIMTSHATHAETVEFLEQHDFFGYPREHVKFFTQGTMPAVDDETGKLLLAEEGKLCTSPDGHGGILKALDKTGMLRDMAERGIEYLYYHQVDNPTARIGDPELVGFHIEHGSELTTKVASKRSADERMGVLALVDGKTQIIEYSDMPDEIAAKTGADGQLQFWAGNMAIHVFNRTFLERAAASDSALPFHVAHKKVPHLDEQGNQVNPESPNAYKFERFIFDALPFAKKALVVEADRQREFNPVKNAEGNDSPATSKAALLALHREWLQAAGVDVPEETRVEISPLFALDEEQAVEKARGLTVTGESLYLQ